MTVPVDAGVDEVREAVDVSGRYRLDPIDKDGKRVEGVPSGYVQITVIERNAASKDELVPTGLTSVDHALREIVRANLELARCNTELAKTVVSRQPDIMTGTAEILRAADGAGLPRREPCAWDDDEHPDDTEDGEAAPEGSPINTIMLQVAPFLQMAQAWLGQKVGMSPAPQPAARRVPARVPSDGAVSADAVTTASDVSEDDAATEPDAAERAPVADIGAHVMHIQAQLTADERRFVEGAVARLTFADMKQWQDQLARMSVKDAVAAIRAEIAKSARPAKAKPAGKPAAINQEKTS
ncbi:MAG: hypothetical protein H0T46_27245 [Deltaproteobacteria bacterium]|nr:hypothetical protein [Deltaproteobacteria bacterium]